MHKDILGTTKYPDVVFWGVRHHTVVRYAELVGDRRRATAGIEREVRGW